MKKRKTAGENCLKAQKDNSVYDPLELGHALTDDIPGQLRKCIEDHNPIFDEEEYCVGFVLAGDPLLKNVMRRKFFAMLYLPSPRPNQTVFLYNKKLDKITKRLWVLPNAKVMSVISTMKKVAKQYETMKFWSDAFFNKTFWESIRKQHDIKMLSENEYLQVNREKLVKSGCKESDSAPAEPFDFSKIKTNQVVDSKIPLFDENILNLNRKTQYFHGNICA